VTSEGLIWIAELALVGLAAGFLAGLLGVGGGIVMVPAMVLLLHFGQHLAQGTSLLVIIPSAFIGSVIHYRSGRLTPRDAVWLAAGGVAGAVIGSVFALSIEDAVLRRLFAILLLVSGLRILNPVGWLRGDRRTASDAEA
jgi:hypothetical protein